MADERNGSKVDKSEQTKVSQLFTKEPLKRKRDGSSIETDEPDGKVSKDRIKSTVKEEDLKKIREWLGDAGVLKDSGNSTGDAKVFKDQLKHSSDSESSSSIDVNEEKFKNDVVVMKMRMLEMENDFLKEREADLKKKIEELKQKLRYFQCVEGTRKGIALKKRIDKVVEEFMNRNEIEDQMYHDFHTYYK